MGQCTSSELPHLTKETDKNGNTNMIENSTPAASESPSHSSTSSSRKYRQSRHSAAASWVTNRLSKRQKKSDLSATFNLLDQEMKGKLVNINTATEEELMTLAGISRQLARSIVDYRNTIGGFRRIEDLVLVSGIGASVLQSIKNDVTIKKYPSYGSSRTQSFDSLPSLDSLKSQKSSQSMNGRSSKNSPVKLINVNSASIFELMNIRGMSQEMAANIVHYRTKKGGFRHIDEMVRVKGINSKILSLLRIYLICDNATPSSPLFSDSVSVSSCGKPPLPPVRRKAKGHRRTQSAPLQSDDDLRDCTVDFTDPIPPTNIAHRFSSDFSEDLFELLSLRSDRPHTYDSFNGSHQGNPAIRVGSWNLQQLSKDKINNPGVLEVICRTILETGFSLIALQEIMSKDVLEKICSELNYGSLRRIREWNGPRGEWRWQVGDDPSSKNNSLTEYAAFIYNTCHGVHLVSCCTLQVLNNNNSKYSGIPMRKPFIGYFKVNDLEMVFVNLTLRAREKDRTKMIEEEADGLENKTLLNGNSPSSCKSESSKRSLDSTFVGPLTMALKEKLEAEKYVLHLGSFDLPPCDKAFDILYDTSHSPVFLPETFTDISYDNPKGKKRVDNLWLSTHCHKLYTGSCGVVREGLSHMAIPRGWGWGGIVSDHCPIYCDLYTQVVSRPQVKSK